MVGAGGAAAIPITGLAVVVATISVEFLGLEGSADTEFSLYGVPGSLSFPDGPGYAAEAGVPSPCYPMYGYWGPLSWINGICPTANEDMTWGAVKSLY